MSHQENQLNAVMAAFMNQQPDTPFTTNISRALQVAEKLQTQGYEFKLKDLCPKNMEEDKWAAIFIDQQGTSIREEHENAATAICRAACAIVTTPKQ
jgi:hypothetical protein